MTSGQSADDGAQVDVEAAWAQIVMHWDDDALAPGAEDVDGLGTLSGEPQLTVEPLDVDPDVPAAGLPDAALRDRTAPHRDRESRRIVRPQDERTELPGLDWDTPTSRVGGDRAADAARWDAHVEKSLDEEGYVPDEPPPLPRGDVISWLAWGGVLGAPVFLLLAALFWRSAPSLLVAGAVIAFVAGFGTLVVRLPDHRSDDEDDGAVV